MKNWLIGILLVGVVFLVACGVQEHVTEEEVTQQIEQEDGAFVETESTEEAENDAFINELTALAKQDFSSFEQKEPTEWGEHVTGVKNRLATDHQVMALTFDACGGPYGGDFDEELIQFLNDEGIPATLFINERWIAQNEPVFLELVENPLFEIANHGSEHLPLSVTGQEAWGISGTSSVAEVVDEVMSNQMTLATYTQEAPKYFRAGTAFYDEVAVEIVNKLGMEVVNFDVLGDAGATYTENQVHNALLNGQPGSIALLHMNQPSSGTAGGVKSAVLALKKQGYSFVTLSEYALN